MTILKVERLREDKSSWASNPFLHAKRVYVNFLQFLFRAGNPLDLLYTEDIKTSQIVIIEGGKVNRERIGKFPVITVARDNARMVMGTFGSLYSQNVREKTVRKEMLTFTLIANIIAEDDIQADDIAYYIMRATWLNHDILSQEGFYSIGTDISATPPGSAINVVEGDSGGLYLVRLILPVRVIVAAQIDPINLEILKKLWVKLQDPITKEEIRKIVVDEPA